MNNYYRKCKEYSGGIKTLWLAPFVDYDESEVFVYDGTLEAFPETTIYLYDVEGEYTQDAGTDESWSQSLALKLSKLYEAIDPAIYHKMKFRAIVETYNDNYIMFGLMGGLKATMGNQSGAGLADFSGLDLTLSGTEEEAAVLVDINDFIDGTLGENFTYTFNFGI